MRERKLIKRSYIFFGYVQNLKCSPINIIGVYIYKETDHHLKIYAMPENEAETKNLKFHRVGFS